MKAMEQQKENGQKETETKNEKDNDKENSKKIKFNQRTSKFTCFVNIMLALFSIGFGIGALLSSKEITYWVPRSAVGIWHGLLIGINAIAGFSALRRPSSILRVRIFFSVTLAVFCISVVCFCFYAFSMDFYKKQTNAHKFVKCVNNGPGAIFNGTGIDERCTESYRKKAKCITILTAFLCVICLMEVIISSFLLITLRKSWRCFYDCWSMESGGDMSLYSVYHGACAYGPSFGQLLYTDREMAYEMPEIAVHKKPQPSYTASKCKTHLQYTRPKTVQKKTTRPKLQTMESITESHEDTEKIDEGIFCCEEESEN